MTKHQKVKNAKPLIKVLNYLNCFYLQAFTVVQKFFVDFLKNSSVHGVKYLGDRERHWTERIFWIVALLISLSGCLIMIQRIYGKWQMIPVIVSFHEKSTPIWQIPFPAVTICPETKVLNEKVNFTEWYHILKNQQPYDNSSQECSFVEALSQICEPHLFENISISSDIETDEISETLYNIAPLMDRTVKVCRWKNKLIECEKLFKEIMSEEGSCYTFNGLSPSQIYSKER